MWYVRYTNKPGCVFYVKNDFENSECIYAGWYGNKRIGGNDPELSWASYVKRHWHVLKAGSYSAGNAFWNEITFCKSGSDRRIDQRVDAELELGINDIAADRVVSSYQVDAEMWRLYREWGLSILSKPGRISGIFVNILHIPFLCQRQRRKWRISLWRRFGQWHLCWEKSFL